MAGEPDLAEVTGRAFGWIGSAAVGADGGLIWLEDGARADLLYSGTAGVLLGCAEAAAGGIDTGQVAAGARDRLLYLASQAAAGRGVETQGAETQGAETQGAETQGAETQDVETLPDDGVFTGWAGVAVALRAWSRVAGDAAAAEAAGQVTAQIAGRVLAAADGAAGCTDIISGDAGILLALIAGGCGPAEGSGTSDSSGTSDGSGTVLRAAAVLAGRLAAAAEPGPDGPHWRMVADWPYLMPGFSHGTAGAAYALAAAGHALDRPDLLDTARRGAGTLIAIGQHADGWAVPLTVPPQPAAPAVNYGWCHGPAGTVRLFVLLNEIDPQPRWQRAIDACVQALRDSRLPLRLYPGYWDNLARCCGTAGVGQLLLDRYQATGDPALLDWAGALADDVVGRAVITPQGITWSNTEHTTTPPQLPPQPGFMQGAAGIAGWLARLHALRTRPGAPVSVPRPGPSWL